MDDLLREFLTETSESLDTVDVQLVRFESEPDNARILDNIFRLVHTIKGTCGFLGLPRLEMLAHAAETLMGQFRDGSQATPQAVTLILATIDRLKFILEGLETAQKEPDGSDDDLIARLEAMAQGGPQSPACDAPTEGPDVAPALLAPATMPEDPPDESDPQKDEPDTRDAPQQRQSRSVKPSLRVSVDTLEQLMTMVSELVLTRNQLLDIARQHDQGAFTTPLQRLSNVTAGLQENVMKTRMQPIGHAWRKLPRIVRDLAAELGKNISLEMQGEQTELDRQVLEVIRDPLTHMVRNSADHGLESTAERIAAGKSPTGHIRLSAYHEGGQIVIEVADDGRGLDTARIRNKALSRGLLDAGQLSKMSDARVHNLIFAAGFSTADTITNISGRGVGMDVVRSNVDQIGGTVDVKSVAGAGLSFTIKIPLTLAIVPALIVKASNQKFAIPQLSIIELVRCRAGSAARVDYIKDAAVLRLRNRLLPLVDLRQLLGLAEAGSAGPGEGDFIVVVQIRSQMIGIAVDGVFHTEEIVVKPVSARLRSIQAFSGTTILGDGSVIMIVDLNGIARLMGTMIATDPGLEDEPVPAAPASHEPKTSLLIVRAGARSAKAVPLPLITRLEEIDVRTIERLNGRPMVQYREQLMPLVMIDPAMKLRAEGKQPVLVVSEGNRSVGLPVDEIIDIVEERLDVRGDGVTPGILGSAIVKGQAAEVVDIAYFLPQAFSEWLEVSGNDTTRRKPSLLLVDDSPFFRNMLMPVLQAAGYLVTPAAGGLDALAVLKSGQAVDVVVTDVDMPDMDGFALVERMREDGTTAHLPVIALSSVVSAEAIERGRQLGLADYVAKFDRAGLIAALKEQAA